MKLTKWWIVWGLLLISSTVWGLSTRVTVDAGAPAAGTADLYITKVELSDPTPQVHEFFNVRVYVENRGDAATDAFDLVVIQGYSPGGPNNPAGLVHLPVAGLEPGNTMFWDFNVVETVAGTYTLRALITDDWYLTGNAEPPIDRPYRAYDVNVTVVDGTPPVGTADLHITKVELSDPTPQVHKFFNVRVYVQNQGFAATDAFDLVVIQGYSPGGPNNPAGLVHLPVAGLGPGETMFWNFNVVESMVGNYTLRALITDDWYLTGNAEPPVDRPYRAYDVNVTVVDGTPPVGTADLRITNVELSNPTPQVHEFFNVRIYVENRGGAATDAFDLVVIQDYSPNGPNNPIGLVHLPVAGLEPGNTMFWDFNVAESMAGNYTLRALITDDWYLTGNAAPPIDRPYRAYDVNVIVGTGAPSTGNANLPSSCPLTPRLAAGMQARVLPGDPHTLHSEPYFHGSTIIRQIPAGAVLSILEGPVCSAEGWYFWRVQYDNQVGWTAEGDAAVYKIEPLNYSGLVQTPPSIACSLTPRLQIGMKGRVLPGTPNRLRNTPGSGSDSIVVGSIPGGGVFSILAGPQCGNDGRFWWQVNYQGTIGWTAEGEGSTYWVEPW